MSQTVYHTADGAELVVPLIEATTLLDAAEQAGYGLQCLCRHGSCGVCRARLVEGEVHLGEHTVDALSDADEAAGWVLLCCGQALGEVRIDLPYDNSRVLTAAVPTRQVRLSEIDHWPGGIVRLVVKALDDPELGSAIQFDAGQFAELTPPGSTRSRAYSFASIANWDGTAEFYVKLRDGGYFSAYVRDQAQIGDILSLRGPQGTFGLRENGSRPRWMVCGGTGLAPIMSMLRRMAEWGETQETLLVLGVNTPGEVYATEAMAKLRQALPNLRTLVSVVTPDAAWTGPVGNAVEIMNAELDARTAAAQADAPDIYLCGPPAFLNAARAGAVNRGVPDEQIYEERIVVN